MANLKIYGFVLILIILAVWQYTRMAEENGELSQANATLNQAVKDSEENYKLMKEVAALNAATVAKTERAKAVLNEYALKKAHELEILKNENIEIKSWADRIIPMLVANQLFNTANNYNESGLSHTADGIINANPGTGITIRNEDTHRYAIDSITALRSCNKDKQGVVDWINANK